VLRLEIHSQPTRIGHRVSFPKIELRVPRVDFQVSTQHANFELQIEGPNFALDASAAYAEIGLRDVHRLAKDFAQRASEAAVAGIDRVVRDGERLAAIEERVDPRQLIAELAVSAAWPDDNKMTNVGLVPTSRISVDVSGHVSAEVGWPDVSVNLGRRQVGIDVTRGRIESYIRQKAKVDIEAVGDRFSVLG